MRRGPAPLRRRGRLRPLGAHRSGRPVAPGGGRGLDPALHYLDAPPEEVARYVLVLDAINFGSGWFDDAAAPASRRQCTTRLTAHARARGGTWSADELRGLGANESARCSARTRARADRPLRRGAAPARRVARRPRRARAWSPTPGARPSGSRSCSPTGMPFFDDVGFYKRAQITANDLVLAGVAPFADVDRLTVFADNLVPARAARRAACSSTRRSSPSASTPASRSPPAARWSARSARARCTPASCSRRASASPPRTLDNWLWNRGQRPPYSEPPAHRTRTVFY